MGRDAYRLLLYLISGTAYCTAASARAAALIDVVELFEVALEVRAARLRARADGHRLVLKVLAGRLRLEEVRAGGVGACDEQPDAVRSTADPLRAELRLVGHLQHEPADLHGRVVDVPVVDALRAHVLGDDARVGDEASDCDAEVVVDLEYLFLVLFLFVFLCFWNARTLKNL